VIAAAQHGHYAVVELLCRLGAKRNERRKATVRAKPPAKKTLARPTADTDGLGQDGVTAVFAAAWKGRTALVELLHAHGWDINLADNVRGPIRRCVRA
jgi:hypothetical protein